MSQVASPLLFPKNPDVGKITGCFTFRVDKGDKIFIRLTLIKIRKNKGRRQHLKENHKEKSKCEKSDGEWRRKNITGDDEHLLKEPLKWMDNHLPELQRRLLNWVGSWKRSRVFKSLKQEDLGLK